MKKLVTLFLIPLVMSCSFGTKDPVNTSGLIPPDQISIGGTLAELLAEKPSVPTTQADSSHFVTEIKLLQSSLEQVKRKRRELDKTDLPEKWDALNRTVLLDFETLSVDDVNAWVALNDSLLKYTQEVRFADALERIAYNPVGDNLLETNQLKSFFYTRLYDRIYFNVFGSSSLQYEHTTGGVVRLVQLTDYPFDNRISIKVELQDTRYLDFFIRIPEWAVHPRVTVKGVKYNVVPGQYTEISRMWKNGDEVEFFLGIEPEVFQNQDSAFALTYGSLFLTHLKSINEQLTFQKENPVDYLKLASPLGQLPTFTFSGIEDTTLVLQPYFSEEQDSVGRTAWISRK